MIEIQIDATDRIDVALKRFKKKVVQAGILQAVRDRRHYVKPSEARALKAAASRRRKRRPVA